MIRPAFLMVIISLMVAGCGRHDAAKIAELEKKNAALEAELAKIKEALKSPPAKPSAGYLDELEKLYAMVTKGTISPTEFEAQKQRILASSHPAAAPIPPSAITPNALQMPELAKQLRLLLELYQNNTINSVERDEKKRQVLAKPLVLVDLKSDLELVTALFNENVITSPERDELKKKLLQDSPIAK